MDNLIENGFFKHAVKGWEVVESTVSQFSPRKVICRANQTFYLKQNIEVDCQHIYFLRFCMKGKGATVQVMIEGSEAPFTLLNNPLIEEQQTLYGNFTANQSQLTIHIKAEGATKSDCQLICVELINLTKVFTKGNEPSAHEFRQQLIKNKKKDMASKVSFIRFMNCYAVQNGMLQSNFTNPNGLAHPNQYSTTADLLKLLLLASGYPAIQKVWSVAKFELDIKGPFARKTIIESTVMDPALANAYYIVGGKTGTIKQFKSLAVILEHPVTAAWIALVVTGVQGNRFEVVKKVIQMLLKEQSIEQHLFQTLAIKQLPLSTPYSQLNKLSQLDIAVEIQKKIMPASITKLLTAVIAVECTNNLHEQLTIAEMDIVGGSGQNFRAGDIITFQEALYCMLLESSNTVANTVARFIGSKI